MNESEINALRLFNCLNSDDIETAYMLLEKGADPNFVLPVEGASPMHIAAGLGDNVVKLLISFGGDPNVRSVDGTTPLHIASSWGDYSCLQLLLSNGGDPLVKDQDGQNVLDLAKNYSHIDCLRLLEYHSVLLMPNEEDLSSAPKYTYRCRDACESKTEAETDSLQSFLFDKQDLEDCLDRALNSSLLSSNTGSDKNQSSNIVLDKNISIASNPLSRHSLERTPIYCLDVTSPGHPYLDLKSSLNEEFLPVDLKQRSKILSSDEDSLENSIMSADKTLPWSKSMKRESTDSNTSGGTFVTCSSHEAAEDISKMSAANHTRTGEGDGSSLDVFDLINQWNNELIVTDKVRVDTPTEKVQDKVATWLVSSDPYHASSRKQENRENPKNTHLRIPKESDQDISLISLESVLPQIENQHISSEQRQYAKEQHNCNQAFTKHKPECNCAFIKNVTDCNRAFTKKQRESIESAYSDASTIEYVYTDQESGIELLEKRIPSLCGSVVSNCSVDSDSTVVYDMDIYLSDKEIRDKLKSLGCDPGPVTASTRQTYLTNLCKLEKEGPSPAKLISDIKGLFFCHQGYLPELSLALSGCMDFSEMPEMESKMTASFDNPRQGLRWREGTVKSSFTYLLLDPRITKNLPNRAHNLDNLAVFSTFIEAIFYVGKGKRARPYAHLYEAIKFQKRQKKPSCKVTKILDIWQDGLGVVSLHCFQSVIPVEAYTREACMVDALGLEKLTNQKRGDYYGIATTWPRKEKRKMGVYLLKKAFQIFLAEGERQICPLDMKV
ncbi:hypothetical protein ScPMuIL_017627 [Solemya velum]